MKYMRPQNHKILIHNINIYGYFDLENIIKIEGDFGAIFLEKSMGYSTGNFFRNWFILKNSHNSKSFRWNQLKLST